MKLLKDFITLHLDLINLKFNKKKAQICINKKCKRVANFNYKKYNEINIRKHIYCKLHKSSEMIDLVSKRCIKCNNKLALYNLYTEKLRLYCGDCKTSEMIDFTGKLCKTNLCFTRVNKKFKGYCLRCFIYNFPNDKLIRDYGTREAKVSEFIKDSYKDLNITYNKIIDGGCSKNRPDIFIDCLTHSVIIEVDEHQHKGNSKSYTPECEIQRVNNIFTDLADRPIIFIRFNPDSYTNNKNKLVKSCFKYTEDKGLPKVTKTLHTRLKKLKETIDKNLNKVPSKNITTIKLYYDGF